MPKSRRNAVFMIIRFKSIESRPYGDMFQGRNSGQIVKTMAEICKPAYEYLSITGMLIRLCSHKYEKSSRQAGNLLHYPAKFIIIMPDTPYDCRR